MLPEFSASSVANPETSGRRWGALSSSDHKAGKMRCWREVGETEEQTSVDTFDGDKGACHLFDLGTARRQRGPPPQNTLPIVGGSRHQSTVAGKRTLGLFWNFALPTCLPPASSLGLKLQRRSWNTKFQPSNCGLEGKQTSLGRE